MKKDMTVAELKEFLNQFPDEAVVCTDTNNHYSTDGITKATLVECGKADNKTTVLFLGNTRHVGRLVDGIGKYENAEYNLAGLKLLKAITV